MGDFPPKICENCIKNLSQRRDFVQNAEVPVFFLCILPIDKRKSVWYNGRPQAYGAAEILSRVMFHNFSTQILCGFAY